MTSKKRESAVVTNHPQKLKNSSVETDDIKRLLGRPTSFDALSSDMDEAVEKTLDSFGEEYRRIIAEKEDAAVD